MGVGLVVQGVQDLLLTEGAPGIEIGRQSIDDSGIVCTQMVLRRCTAGAALLPSCCCPAATLLLPSCCCPAETHLTPPAGGGGDRTFDVPAGKCGSDISQVWRGVPDPRPVVGKCATRTFSSNLYWASVLLALSRQNGQCYVSLISRGVRPGYSRAYISLY